MPTSADRELADRLRREAETRLFIGLAARQVQCCPQWLSEWLVTPQPKPWKGDA